MAPAPLTKQDLDTVADNLTQAVRAALARAFDDHEGKERLMFSRVDERVEAIMNVLFGDGGNKGLQIMVVELAKDLERMQEKCKDEDKELATYKKQVKEKFEKIETSVKDGFDKIEKDNRSNMRLLIASIFLLLVYLVAAFGPNGAEALLDSFGSRFL